MTRPHTETMNNCIKINKSILAVSLSYRVGRAHIAGLRWLATRVVVCWASSWFDVCVTGHWTLVSERPGHCQLSHGWLRCVGSARPLSRPVSAAAGDRRFFAARADDDDDDNASLTSLPTDAAAATVGATDRRMRSEERAMRRWFGRAERQSPSSWLIAANCHEWLWRHCRAFILRSLVVNAVLFLYKRSADDHFASK